MLSFLTYLSRDHQPVVIKLNRQTLHGMTSHEFKTPEKIYIFIIKKKEKISDLRVKGKRFLTSLGIRRTKRDG